jgi:hypothetical protein
VARENTVLSLNPDGKTLLGTESALRKNGFTVISVPPPIQARFEIEMGRCGVFLSRYITPSVLYKGLTGLFRQNCPGGLVVFVFQQADDVPGADIIYSERDDPWSIVQRIRSKRGAVTG